MNSPDVYITRFSAWTDLKAPEITFTDPLFRRRLSQISKMTIQVVHDLLPLPENTKMIFVSFRGEITKQFKINKMQIQDSALMPALFSFSVFNAPPALASMAFSLKGGYTAIYPGKNSFSAGIMAAKAPLFAGTAEQIVFIYADEAAPQEYFDLFPDCPPPLAFALLLDAKPGSNSIPLSAVSVGGESPAEFIQAIIHSREINGSR